MLRNESLSLEIRNKLCNSTVCAWLLDGSGFDRVKGEDDNGFDCRVLLRWHCKLEKKNAKVGCLLPFRLFSVLRDGDEDRRLCHIQADLVSFVRLSLGLISSLRLFPFVSFRQPIFFQRAHVLFRGFALVSEI